MSKHPIDHDRERDDAKVAKEYARIARETGDGSEDPKVRMMTKAGRVDETRPVAAGKRLKKFLNIDRERADS